MILARLLSATPQTDGEHWDFAFQEIQDVWGTDAFAQNPAPYQRNPNAGGRIGPPWPWSPYTSIAGTSDAMFPGEGTFSLNVDTSSYPANLEIYGAVPVNTPQPGNTPQAPLDASVANTGGTIGPGSYLIALSNNANIGPISKLFIKAVVPAGTNTNTIAVSGIVWDPSVTTPNVFLGIDALHMRYLGPQGFHTFWTGSSPDAHGNPTVITITAQPADALGLPDANFRTFLVEETDEIHGGDWGDVIASVTGSNVLNFPAGAWSTNQWQNHVLSLLYRPDVDSQPVINVTVASNTANTLTVSRAGLSPVPASDFLPGDVVVMRFLPDSITATTVGDANLVNSYSPSGLTVNQDGGALIRIIAGTGAGYPPKTVVSNTATVWTISTPWDVTPDATSIFIVTEATVIYEYSTQTFMADASTPARQLIARTYAVTTDAQQIFVQVATVDSSGNSFPMRYQPFREIYIPLQNPGTAGVPSIVYAVPITAIAGVQTATPDASQGANLLVLTAAVCSTDSNGNLFVNVAAPINYSIAAGVYTLWQLITQEDPVGGTGGYSTVFDPVGGTYRIGFAVASPASPANTQCHVDFKTSSSGVTTPTGSLIDQPI